MADSISSREIVTSLRNSFNSGKTRPVDYRIKQLKALKKLCIENHEKIVDALQTDLRKSRAESVIMETDMVMGEIDCMIDNIKNYTKPEKPTKYLANILDSVLVFKEPYGVVLIIGAWNYPWQLTILPVAGAIAAGNCVIIKPSDLSVATTKLTAELFAKYLDPDCCQVYLGGVDRTTELLKEKFDYIFYTGSTSVGRIIQQAAAKNLTPTTLELGGKSPVYVDSSADIVTATKRILWGKFANCGQTCVAPDYLLCTKEVQDKFVAAAKKVIKEFYGEKAIESPDYGRIINDNHFNRVVNLLKSGEIAIGGSYDAKERFIEPTILKNVKPSDPIMQEEIFGPILPIITINNLNDVIDFINKGEKPLALYIFSNRKSDVKLLLNNTSAGGVTVNDTIMHLAVDSLPFGGVGSSGMGRYHGKYTFDTFTHEKACLYKNLGVIGEKLSCARYPPFSAKKMKFIRFLLTKRSLGFFGIIKYLAAFGLGLFVSAATNLTIKLKN